MRKDYKFPIDTRQYFNGRAVSGFRVEKKESKMKNLITDTIGALCLFITGYGLLFLPYLFN